LEAPRLRLDRLRGALLDAFVLLSRGYPRKPVLDLVYAKWGLNRWERLAVYHCSHGVETIRRVRSMTRCYTRAWYSVDGYNVGVSLVCMDRGVPVLLCPDGYIRDVMGGWKPRPEELLDPLADYIHSLEESLSSRAVVYLDARVSRSGELASMLRRRGVLAATSRTTDKSVLLSAARRGYTPVTSDIVVLERVGGCNHLTHYALLNGANVIDVPLILREGLEEVLELWIPRG